ncbi:MAG: sialate O-acetylesterase, partial [Ilumatobacteraceae bacterium]
PVDRHVFQRRTNDSGVVRIILRKPPAEPNTIVEARLTRIDPARRGTDLDWTTLSPQPLKPGKDNVPLAAADLPASAGGWYRLDIRARAGEQVIAAASVPRVGIGEVFITAGQSNSSNWGQGTQEARDDRVVYCDGNTFVPARDPLPDSYGAERKENHGNQYPALGERLAASWGVPVAFRSATIAATQVSEWMPRNGEGAPGVGNRQFRNLVDRITPFGPHGVRAVLWHQGEYDAIFGVPNELYRDILSHVIRQARKEIGYEIDWFVAEAYKPQAQRMLWESKVCFPGPLSDDLTGKQFRWDGIHFGTAGLVALARRWFEVLDKRYGAAATAAPAKD